MTIANDVDLRQALDAISNLRLALASLRRNVGSVNTTNFCVLAEGPIDELTRIEADVDAYLGLDEARAPLWVRVEGEGIDAGNAPTSVMTAILNSFRKGLQAATEHLVTGRLSARPTAAVQQAVDVRLTALAPGSLRLGLSIQGVEGDDALSRAVVKSLDEYLAVVEWAATGPDLADQDRELALRIPDKTRRRLLLNLVLQLAPRTRGIVENVEFSGRAVKAQRPLGLSRASREHLAAALDRIESSVAEDHIGRLRELDLDKLTGVVRSQKVELPCEFAEELMTSAQEALGRPVRVIGNRSEATGRRRTTLFVTRLEILDEASVAED